MEKPLSHLNALRAFEAAARYGGFAGAARELNVSHSVISQHVKNLEAWLGATLFERSGNSVRLSDDGRILASRVSRAFTTLRDACNDLHRPSRSVTVTVSAEPAVALRWLRKQASLFSRQHPAIDIDIKPAWRFPALDESVADMAVHFADDTFGGDYQLFPIDGFIACAPSMRKRIRIKAGLASLDGLPLIHDNGREVWRKWYSTYLPDSLDWQKGKVYTDLSLAIEAAIDGEGLILADRIICRREIEAGQLVQLDERIERCTWYALNVRKDQPLSPAARLFRDWLIESNTAQAFAKRHRIDAET